jgi:DNA (cytosine-5)-methyltransferase 3A
MNVLSLFDGISCGREALERARIPISNYFSSEIEPNAMKVSKANWPDIIQLGDVCSIKTEDLPEIDIIIGGSPCTNFSSQGAASGLYKGMMTSCNKPIVNLNQYLEFKEQGVDFFGESFLFWEYVHLIKKLKPKVFLLENVMMNSMNQHVISEAMEVAPIHINSSLLSAQKRSRLYWTNLAVNNLPRDKGIFFGHIKDNNPENWKFVTDQFLEKRANRTEKWQGTYEDFDLADDKKVPCLVQVVNNRKLPRVPMRVDGKDTFRVLTAIEGERCQTLPDNYTSAINSAQNRLAVLGNAWTVDVITYILLHYPKMRVTPKLFLL